MRSFLAFPFLMCAKGFAEIASFIDNEPVICFSLRDAVEITDDNMDEIIEVMEMEDKDK